MDDDDESLDDDEEETEELDDDEEEEDGDVDEDKEDSEFISTGGEYFLLCLMQTLSSVIVPLIFKLKYSAYKQKTDRF
ncbi:hypothetical protein DPMN_008545 [Dreissena polymorpha]|uniref:Uncharacterized protein n=1 Tax=Dreissena polymorpha TaxID=45954 RepID=A0A9D4N0L7_DREPO|nr:hypothetical protein DPMN_008545 [Dreissena polymorpha]